MSILKCKICGGDMEISADRTFGTCEYCGSTMTLPKIGDDVRAAAFNRGNHFRRAGEFDKALSVYEKIVEESPDDAEAHWCCALCRFGIEWVEDPTTLEYLPTCHRASFDPFTEDVDCKAAIELSDGLTRRQYQKDAARIAEVQKGILAASQNEKPFDVFICYKETDENGQRTVDSTLAQDIYYQLTDHGLRVFFARITLEDKAGSEYEPYIFAALNSAKAMVVVGTKPEHFNAVWVKNEWSRFLSIVKRDRRKVLLPCYRDMDPYDLPEQLSILQSYDMSKIGFIQDLIRGIKKIVKEEDSKSKPVQVVKETVVAAPAGSVNVAPLLKRAFIFLEDGNWEEADAYCERVLDQDPENGMAYVGKLMAELHVKKQEDLANCEQPFDGSANFQKAVRFGDEKLAAVLKGYIARINERNETARLTEIYDGAVSEMKVAKTEEAFKAAAETFRTIPGFKDADELVEECLKKAEFSRKDVIYQSALSKMNAARSEDGFKSAAEAFKTVSGFKDADELVGRCLDNAEACRKNAVYDLAVARMKGNSVSRYEEAIKQLQTIPGWKDSDDLVVICRQKIEKIRAKEEADRLERERKAEERKKAKEKNGKRTKKTLSVVALIVAACLVFSVVIGLFVFQKKWKYDSAVSLCNSGEYEEAKAIFEALDGYKDSAEQIEKCEAAITDSNYNSNYNNALSLLEAGKYEEAITAFEALNGYKDSAEQIKKCKAEFIDSNYNNALSLLNAGKYEEAVTAFEALGGYKDSLDLIVKCHNEQEYKNALSFITARKYADAYELLMSLNGFKDSASRAKEIRMNFIAEKLRTAKIGDYVVLGHYEQDNDTSNGKEDIEWLVLAKEGKKILVISRYALDCKPYNTSYTGVTWATCSLRTWLNGTFFNNAFSSEEQKKIPTTTVTADKNPSYSTLPGSNTNDKVFLLSITEVNNYFNSEDARINVPTAFAIASGAYSPYNINGKATSFCWLRTPGSDTNRAAGVTFGGSVTELGDVVDMGENAVRPALWIDLGS